MREFILGAVEYGYLKSQPLFIYKTVNAFCQTPPLVCEESREGTAKFGYH